MIRIQEEDFNPAEIIEDMDVEGVGAVVTFTGLVRNFTFLDRGDGGRERTDVKRLIFESYNGMAQKKLGEIKEKAIAKFHLNDLRIIHRVGDLKPEERIVFIAVSSAHRKDAFSACQYVIDGLKIQVPIWKKEITSSGEHWVDAEDQKGTDL